MLGRVSAVVLTAEAAATLIGALAGPILAQAAQLTAVAAAASLVTLSAAALARLTVPPIPRRALHSRPVTETSQQPAAGRDMPAAVRSGMVF